MIKKITGTIRKMLVNNPLADSYYSKKRDVYMTKDFLSSPEYEALFQTHADMTPEAYAAFLNDAEEMTDNFKYRHFKLAKALGSWRWKGVFQNRNSIISVLFDDNLKGIDFGGAYGPISKHASIVDFNKRDVFGRQVKYNSLENLDFQPDFIFSSHTLEHIKDLDAIFTDFNKVLAPGGTVFLNLPAYSCARWRSGDHTNRKFNDHAWTFCLSSNKEEVEAMGFTNTMAIDEKVAAYFTITKAEYTGDNSIFISAKKA